MPLPHHPTHAEYDALRPNSALWLQAMQRICQRHHLPAESLSRFGDGTTGDYGTNIVYAVGESLVIKLYPPYWRRLYEAERTVGEYIYTKLSVTTPQLHGQGELEGWPYLVMSRLTGTPLHELWETLDKANQLALALELAEMLAQLHTLPTNTLTSLEANWPQLVQQRVADCVARHREQDVPDAWLEQMPDFLARAMPLYPSDFPPAIVSGDVHQWHLFAQQQGGRWRLSSLFDFDDARLGFCEYDLAATGLFLLARRPTLLRPFLVRYGYAQSALDDALSHRLLAYTLLHRYRPFNWVREAIGDPICTTLDSLARSIYALG